MNFPTALVALGFFALVGFLGIEFNTPHVLWALLLLPATLAAVKGKK